MFGKLNNFVVLSTNNFELCGAFQLDSTHPDIDHCYIYSGYIDYSWLIGINSSQKLSLWLGNGLSWNLFNGLALDFHVEKNRKYEIRLTRIADRLNIYIDQKKIDSINIPKNYTILGSHLGIGVINKIRSVWSIRIDVPSIKFFSSEKDFSSFGKKINFLSVFYGSNYSQSLQNIMFPSLLLRENIPALEGRTISHYIYCSKNEEKLLRQYVLMLKKMGIECIVNSEIIPSVGNQRNYLYLPFLKEMERSIEESSIVVMAQPDHIFGRGLAKVIDAMQPYDYVVCGHPRVSEQQGLIRYPGFLMDQLQRDKFETNPSNNKDFVLLAMTELLHPMVAHGLREVEYYWHSIRRKSYFSTYFKEPPPLCFHAHPEMINVVLGDTTFGRFETLDHDLVDLAYQQKRLKVIDDSNDFFWAELTKDEVYNPTIYNKYWSDAAKQLFHTELKWHFE